MSFGSEGLVVWAEQYAQKASEIVSAAAEVPDAAERVAGVLLAPSDGWPLWVTFGASTPPAHHLARQLVLVDALSQQLDFAAVLHSSQWLAKEILATPEDAGMQTLGALRERTLHAIVSELGEDATNCRAEQTIFATTAARSRLQHLDACVAWPLLAACLVQLSSEVIVLCIMQPVGCGGKCSDT